MDQAPRCLREYSGRKLLGAICQADLSGLDGIVGHPPARLAPEDRRDDYDDAAAATPQRR
jgi:hypothetical protein